MNYALREVFQVIARENPYMIGTSDDAVAFNGTGWPRPANALRVIGVRATAGTVAMPAITVGARISVLPYDDASFNSGVAGQTELGQAFVPRGGTKDPSGGTLKIIYAKQPDTVTAVGDTIDPLFPESQVDLLNYDMALYLAEQDKRSEDAQTFSAMKSALLALLIEWTHGQTYELVQRFPIVTPPLTNANGGRQAPLAAG